MKTFGLLLFLCVVLRATTALSKTVCEHKTLSINCGSGKTIEFVEASYGRSDRSTCPNRAIYTTSCDASSSDRVVRRACHGKQSCSVRASNSVFGDPCVRTVKYLTVKYNCRATVNICEHRRQTLSCPQNQVIDIISAAYGRSDRSTCPNRAIKTTRCSAGTSAPIVKASCNGRSSCTLHASNGVFGDPCVGTFKYLRVNYRCKDASPLETSICERSSSTIGCPAGKRLRITEANYGRTSTATCRHGADGNTNCRRNAVFAVRSICEGRPFCSLTASNSFFGDPCRGIHKYLFVKYNCA